ncbi:hypothetical protein [Blastococcus sp. SYSU DS0533]
MLASGGADGLQVETDVEVAGTVQGSSATTAAEEDLGVDLDGDVVSTG